MLVNLSRDRVLARCFLAGELLHGSGGFLERAGRPSEQRPAIRTEKKGGTFYGRSIDWLGGGEVVLLFILIHLPLDFLGCARHPGILHLPQPLLYMAATSVEGCLVCSGRAIEEGFVQLVLLYEQNVDICVVVSEPVLVLMTCAAEDIQGGGLDGVPQLTPPVLRGADHVGALKVG
ncbi:unnamed protein product [Schistocephalus solidus]|uniref:Uncharacterized protein n=1 Tax=Schistocephalus solidus TaxID=70667 RepID=A0A183T107_SCHSO|nr:unnamed protein product [Schistocephalus solidus]